MLIIALIFRGVDCLCYDPAGLHETIGVHELEKYDKAPKKLSGKSQVSFCRSNNMAVVLFLLLLLHYLLSLSFGLKESRLACH